MALFNKTTSCTSPIDEDSTGDKVTCVLLAITLVLEFSIQLLLEFIQQSEEKEQEPLFW